MDTERKKRKQLVRVMITEAVMVISVVVIVALLMFMVMGYSLRTGGEEWSVEQSGLVQLVSTPSGASIEIDGEGIFQRTETSRMLSEGEHEVRLYRSGYDDWKKKITVRPGVFLRLKYPRLFKDDRKAEQAKVLTDLDWVSFADNRNSLLYATKESAVWHWLSLRNDTLTETEIDTSTLFTGTVESMKWVGNGEKLLLKANEEGGVKWLVVDLKTPAKSINVTEEFGLDFSLLQPLNDAADRLWAVENGKLRELYLSSREVSAVIANNVTEIASNRAELVYVTRAESGERTVFTYKDGASESVTVKKVAETEPAVRVAVEEYLGDTYLSLMVGRKYYGYRADDFPVEGQKFEMELFLEQDLSIVPESFKVSNNGQFVIAGNGAKIALMDAETEQIYEYELETDKYFWLDDYLIGTVVDGELVVRDFDGTNRRKLTEADGKYPAIIAVNERWLYYFVEKDGQISLNREEL